MATTESPGAALDPGRVDNSIILSAIAATWSSELASMVGARIDCTLGGSLEKKNFLRRG